MSNLSNEKEIIRILYIEDDIIEYKIVSRLLLTSERNQFELTHAITLNDGIECLKNNTFDLILLDLGLPESFGKETFYHMYERIKTIPIIVITGTEDEDIGIELIKSGAQDYLIKGRVNAPLLIKSISYAIERHNLVKNLNLALKEIKTLSGLVPICANCKKIRDDQGFWTQVEIFIEEHSEAQFSHSICPDCQKALYGKVYD